MQFRGLRFRLWLEGHLRWRVKIKCSESMRFRHLFFAAGDSIMAGFLGAMAVNVEFLSNAAHRIIHSFRWQSPTLGRSSLRAVPVSSTPNSKPYSLSPYLDPLKYVEIWSFGLYLGVLGNYFTYLWGLGRPKV